MSDLISRKALLENMKNSITENSDTFDWINLINRQPTAYDVDKVVEQIKFNAIGIPTIRGINMVVGVGTAENIVKGGGVDE